LNAIWLTLVYPAARFHARSKHISIATKLGGFFAQGAPIDLTTLAGQT